MNSGIRPIVKYQYYSAKNEPETKTSNIYNKVDFLSRTNKEYLLPKTVRDHSIKNVSVGKHVEKLEKSFVSRVQSDNIDLKSRGGCNFSVTRDTCLSRGGYTRTRDNRRASREITSTKEFEDRATNILAEMRKQRRSLKLESASSVSSVSSNLRTGGWRETMKKSATREDVCSKVCQTPPKQSYLSHKRSSISEFVGKVIRKLSVGKEGSQEAEPRTQRPVAQFINPLDFILMKEEYLRKNPPPPPPEKPETKKPPEDSMACVMDSLKKMVKKINPKREFPGDKEEAKVPMKPPLDLRSPQAIYEERMKKYQGAALTPFNSHSSKYNTPGDKREIRERIQTKVLSSISQPQQIRLSVTSGSCETIEPQEDISVRIYPVRHWKLANTAVTSQATVLSTVEFRRAEKVELSSIIAQFNKTDKAKKKLCHAKLVIHGLNDPKGERFCYALITRSSATFATVRPINVAVKKKTELFAPKLRGRATVSIDSLMVAVVTAPGTCGTTMAATKEERGDRGCALFGRVGPGQEVSCQARLVRRLVLSLPVMAIMDTDSETSDKAQFTKCDRVPQSQIVQMILSSHMGTLSRISFHHPPVFHYQDVVITLARFLRTKKDLNRFKFKQEEFISRVVSEASGEDSNNKDGDAKFLSYGTV